MATATKVDVRELLKAGAHFGHKAAHWNPRMRPFIHSKRGGIYIIDLIQTSERLGKALEFVEKLASEGKQVLFVGTKRHTRQVVKEAAVAAGMPYVYEHWLGGTLTNFDTISGRVKHLKKLEEMQASGELAESRNKREQGELKEEMAKLNQTFGGIKDMDKIPAALFIADVVTERTAAREAIRLGVPVVGIVDTNANPEGIDYVVPANDDAVSTVKLIAEAISDAIVAGKAKQKPAAKAEPAENSKAKSAKKAAN